MANHLATVSGIRDQISSKHEVTLNGKIEAEDRKILGEECLGFLGALFGRQASFALTNCTLLEPESKAENYLIFSGSLKQLLSWSDVSVEMALVDLPAPNGAGKRHCVFRTKEIAGDNVHLFSDHFLRLGTSITASEGTLARSLEDYVGNVSFSEKTVICSSVDYSAVGPTKLSANFIVPAVNATVSITVGSTAWMGGNSYDLFITGAGYYQVQSITNGTQVVVLNLGTSSNVAVGTNVRSGAAVVPSRLHRLMTLDAAFQAKAGVNFPVDLVLDADLKQYLAQIVGQLDNTGKSQGLIYPGDSGLYLMFRKGITGARLVSDVGVGLEVQGMSLVLPSVPDDRTGPEIVFDGVLRIGTKPFSMRAGFNAYYETVALSCYDFPTLKEMIDLIGNGDACFGEPLSSLLSVRLSNLGVVFGLRDKSVAEISFSVTAQDDIKLIEKIISFKPALNMRIEAPFDSELRSIEGELEGTWKLGDTAFKTALYYPSFDFTAGMAPDQSLDLLEVVKSILSAIGFPKPDIGVPVTRMEVWGNFLDKSFSAEIDANYEWQFFLAGRPFGLRISKLLVAYAGQSVGCTVDGAFKLAGADVLVSAGYDADQGLMLSGSTVIGEKINLSQIAKDLLEAMALPTDRRGEQIDLKLTDITFSAAPKAGEYSLSGRTDGAWQLTNELSLTVERFAAEKRQGLSVTGLLRVTLDIGGKISIRLSAEKAAAGAGGWKFEGSSVEGQKINIFEFVEWVGEKFGGKPQLPEAIKTFKVDKLRLSFESESKDFFFTCEGEVTLPGWTSAIQGIITIDIKHQDKTNYTKLFGGSLIIDGIEFDLIFESSKAAGGDSQIFLASYHDAKGHPIEIDDLIKRICPTEASSTGLEISLKDALFAYQKKGQSKYLLGLDIEGGLNLSELNLPNLPLIGQPFPAGQTLKLALQVLYADKDKSFTVDEINALNKLNAQGIRLPQQEVKGLKLAALLRMGEETKPLSLPIGLSKTEGLVEDKENPTAAGDQPVVKSKDSGTQWINIQKTFGPIRVERVGVGFQSGNIALLLDAALSAAGLTLSLDGLGAEFALKDLAKKEFKPTFHLNGLGIDYRNGPVEIGGSFLEQKGTLKVDGKDVDYTSYAGLAVIRTKKLTLSAIGSYAQINGRDPSLFIYAVANYPLGGPAFFYVTGFAAGFGYNRALNLPPIDEIASFPLVAEAVKDGGPASLPSGQKEQKETLTTKLQQLERYLPPSVGDIFIAAGIKFTSFKLIDSFALLVVRFGRRFEIDLLGLATLTAPPPEAGKAVAPIAEAQLALKATFIPAEGFLGVRAQLTPNSYILSKDCHLTGGFAFYAWFEPSPHAGDFVLTLGGYHPKFIVPDHYPKVPRLALNWQVTPELHIKADAYFALTASAIMAGGHLQATWESGDLRAWFVAGADFLLAWKPFHYDLELYVGMGVSYTFRALGNQTLNVDLGANLHLWGPPFSGTATIHWSIISFTVNFGEGAAQHLQKLDWDTFKTSFLPKPEQICSIAVQEGLTRQMKAAEPLFELDPADCESDLNQKRIPAKLEQNFRQRQIQLSKKQCRVLLPDSVISVICWFITDVEHQKDYLIQKEGEKLKVYRLLERWIVNPKEMVLTINSAIPLKTVETLPALDGGNLAIAPMGIESNLTSHCSITITRGGAPVENDTFQVDPIRKSMPAGLWGKPNLTVDKKYLKPPSLNGAQLVDNMLTGFEIRPKIKKDQQAHTCDIKQDELQYTTEVIKDAYRWQDFSLAARRGRSAWDQAAKTVAGKGAERDKLLTALGLVNAEIDFGEPIKQVVSLAA